MPVGSISARRSKRLGGGADGEGGGERGGDDARRVVHPADDQRQEVLDQRLIERRRVDQRRSVGEAEAEQVEGVDAEIPGERLEDAAIFEGGGAGVHPVDEDHRRAPALHRVRDAILRAAVRPGKPLLLPLDRAVGLAGRAPAQPTRHRHRAAGASRRQRRHLPARQTPP